MERGSPMASAWSVVLDLVLRSLHVKDSFEKMFNRRTFGKGDLNEPPKSLYASLDIEKTETGKGNIFYLSPKPEGILETTKKQILYLHGGGYVHGFNQLHWLFLKTLAQTLNCTIIAPDYPVAPEFTYHDSFAMVIPLYKKLVSEMGGENLIIMGDSSGGGFALALAQKMKEEKIEMASQIIMISPWLDITLRNRDIPALDSQDPILGVKGLRRAGLSYAGDTNPNNYLLSPINGPVDGLGKITIFIGTKDILLADTRKFKAIAEGKGIEINYYEYEEMLHIWPLFNLPESKKAIDQIHRLVNG